MIDLLWIENNNNIKYALEVENSTNFISGIQRASNLDSSSNKIMVVPDTRIKEFKLIRDPLFIDNFKKYNWCSISYKEIEKLKSLRNPNKKDLDSYSKHI